MNCLICNHTKFEPVFSYNKPDMYESWMQLSEVRREWQKCKVCGFHRSVRNYSLKKFQKIYVDGYRDNEFRGKTIKEAFDAILAIDKDKSENFQRFKWFIQNITNKSHGKALDIGSGLGVWPYVLKKANYDVECIELNQESCSFITNELGIPCYTKPKEGNKYDIISCVHVLEHIEDARDFVSSLIALLNPGGEIFFEVPDAVEFNYLDKDNNEFSSDHVWFFDLSALYRFLDSCGLEMIHTYRPYYEERQLSRILTIARPKKQ